MSERECERKLLDVVVDDREPAEVIAHLQAQAAVCVTVRRLDLGDYRVAGRVIVERKTTADFAVSLVDGRLFRQACRISASFYRPLMVIEGDEAIGASGVSREAIQGAIVMLTLILAIPCVHTRNAAETANIIRFAGEQMARHARHAVGRSGYRPKRRRSRQLFILQGLPGVGPVRAGRLLDRFGSIQAVFSADLEALLTVEDLGVKTAQAIRDLAGPDVEVV